jgi:2-polyprenyl-6-methoxyphenol hydroxylase-like FAD-dependent oxidoreductase
MDLTIAYFTIPKASTDDRMWRWFNAPGKRSVSLRPDRHGTTRAMLSVAKKAAGEQEWDMERQKIFLRDLFADAGWETPRILAGMDAADDFYFDALRQVRMPRWSSGRVVLTGDAAWCVTPLGGIGATLAVTGAYVLAQEIARHEDIAAAFDAYEQRLRPMVEESQGIPKLAPRLLHPKSRLGIRLLHGVLGLASLEPVRDMTAKMIGSPGKQVDVAEYG